MTKRIYEKHASINYQPFLICSVALTDDEASMVLGSSDLKKNTDVLVKNVLEISKVFSFNPASAMAFSWKGNIIGAHVIHSQIQEARGRQGLKLIYGLEISHFALSHKQNVFSSAFNLYHSYLAQEFDMFEFDLANMDKIIAKFQERKSPDDVITEQNINKFFQQIEVESFIDSSRAGHLICKIRHLINKWGKYNLIQRIPLNDLQQSKRFWSGIDELMYKRYNRNKSTIDTQEHK